MLGIKESEAHILSAKEHYQNTFSPENISIYQYWANVKQVVDADTLDLEVSVGFNLTISERFRLIGLNAPEIHGVKKTSSEFKRGTAAKAFVEDFLPDHQWVEVEIFVGKREKYGRWLCQIFSKGESLNVALLTSGNAAPI